MKQETVKRTSGNRGFSLVELSIVLVILGLLVGGVLSGQSLIRAAELRSVTTGFSKYHTAVLTFQDKYMAIPGDMTNATNFWGSASGTGADATCIGGQTDSAKNTCNGNGNGMIDAAVTGVTWPERFMSWKHLANAGLIEGSYTGKTDGTLSDPYKATPEKNVPSAKLSQAFFDLNYEAYAAGLYAAGTTANTNVIAMYGASGATLKPEEAWSIDKKLDDGSPVYGKIFANKKGYTTHPDCSTSDADNAEYDMTQTSAKCNLKYAFQ